MRDFHSVWIGNAREISKGKDAPNKAIAMKGAFPKQN